MQWSFWAAPRWLWSNGNEQLRRVKACSCDINITTFYILHPSAHIPKPFKTVLKDPKSLQNSSVSTKKISMIMFESWLNLFVYLQKLQTNLQYFQKTCHDESTYRFFATLKLYIYMHFWGNLWCHQLWRTGHWSNKNSIDLSLGDNIIISWSSNHI